MQSACPSPILVTGATGFIGSHLVRALVDSGHAVHGLARTTPAQLPESPLTWWQADIRDTATLESIVSRVRPTAVIHCAVSTAGRQRQDEEVGSREVRSVNVDGMRSLIAALRPVRESVRVVRLGTTDEYGYCARRWLESAAPAPTTVYGETQVEAAKMLHEQLRATSLRLALVYGPGRRSGSVITHALEHFVLGRPLDVRHPGARRDAVFVGDTVLACELALRQRAAIGETINIGTGEAYTAAALVDAVATCVGRPPPGLSEPQTTEFDRLPDVTKAVDILGFRAQTPLVTGLGETAHWFAQAVGR